jgi:hypothetical protein
MHPLQGREEKKEKALISQDFFGLERNAFFDTM